MKQNIEQKGRAPESENVRPKRMDEPSMVRRKAVKFKAFRHIFSEKDIKTGVTQKTISKKLKQSKYLENKYYAYLKELEKNPSKTMLFPWDSPLRRIIFFIFFWGPKFLFWGWIICLFLFIINYIPGPTQHTVELLLARSLYDTARNIHRLPESLATYAHSAGIVDKNGSIIKAYGKREVTKKIPDRVRMALLACEDHYLLPHENNPWHVNSFLIHAGVSWINLLGAVKDTMLGNTRGASTIVMQNAKKMVGNDKRNIGNKIEEIILAYLLVSKFGKEKNLDFYINTVPVGANIYGFTAAAKNYFKKELDDLNMQQIVTISSFIPNHNRQIAFYEIVKGKNFSDLSQKNRFHANKAINKINMALAYLRNLDEITKEEYRLWRVNDESSIRKIGFRDFRSPLYGEEEWTSWNVIKEVCSRSYTVNGREISGSRLILDERGDVVVETGVDLVLVEKIKEIISEFLKSKKFRKILRKRNLTVWHKDAERYEKLKLTPPYEDFEGFMRNLYQNINIGVIAINRKGEIIAYVGGKEFLRGSNDPDTTEYNNSRINPSSSGRNIVIDLMNKKAKVTPSSTIKPFIAYYNMVANDVNLESVYIDKPVEYKYVKSVGKKIWMPRNWYNYDKKGEGANRYLGRRYSLLNAQVFSVNTIFAGLYSTRRVRNAILIGFDKIGLEYNHEDAKYWPFGIGASEVPVQQWLGLYNAFLDGYYRQPAFVKRILVDGKIIYDQGAKIRNSQIMLFDAKTEREDEMKALYEVCNRGTASKMKNQFKYHKNLVSGKTGTAPGARSSLFVGHFNPYLDRAAYDDKTMTLLVAVTTNTGGHKSVGTSTQGPVVVAGKIFNYMYEKKLHLMMDELIGNAKRKNAHLRNNHVYWANVNRYMDHLLNKKCGKHYIYEYINGVDGYQEALGQILNSSNKIYTGKNDLFDSLVEYYCDQKKVVKMDAGSPLRKKNIKN